MTIHYSILAWEIPWTEEPGGLESMGSQKGPTWLSDFTTTHTQTSTGKMGNLNKMGGLDQCQ